MDAVTALQTAIDTIRFDRNLISFDYVGPEEVIRRACIQTGYDRSIEILQSQINDLLAAEQAEQAEQVAETFPFPSIETSTERFGI